MNTMQALRERSAAKAKDLREFMDKSKDRKWTDDDQKVYDEHMAEIDDCRGRIDRMQKVIDLDADKAFREMGGREFGAANDELSPRNVYKGWLRRGEEGLNADERAVFRNTMSTTTGSQGGYTVETEVAKELIEALKAYGGMRAVSDQFTTLQGNDIQYPTSDGTSEVGELIGQNTTATGLDPSFSSKTLSTYKFSSKVIAVPYELLQDSTIDIEAMINKRMRTRLGRIQNTYFTTGTGTGQPNGIVTATGVGKTGLTGQTLTWIFDDVIDLQHSVDPAYRQGGNCRWMMNDASVKVTRKIKDSNNRPIFVPGYQTDIPGKPGGIPDSIAGDPVTVNQDIAVMAADAVSVLYGDFSYYKIRDCMDVTMFRFTDSAYAKLGQVGFLAWMRSGGQWIDAGGGAVKQYVNSHT